MATDGTEKPLDIESYPVDRHVTPAVRDYVERQKEQVRADYEALVTALDEQPKETPKNLKQRELLRVQYELLSRLWNYGLFPVSVCQEINTTPIVIWDVIYLLHTALESDPECPFTIVHEGNYYFLLTKQSAQPPKKRTWVFKQSADGNVTVRTVDN